MAGGTPGWLCTSRRPADVLWRSPHQWTSRRPRGKAPMLTRGGFLHRFKGKALLNQAWRVRSLPGRQATASPGLQAPVASLPRLDQGKWRSPGDYVPRSASPRRRNSSLRATTTRSSCCPVCVRKCLAGQLVFRTAVSLPSPDARTLLPLLLWHQSVV